MRKLGINTSYRNGSYWNDQNEIRCLIIFKKLQEENFPRGRHAELSKNMEKITKLTAVSIKAKVGNYKSVAKINNHSNASKNTKIIFKRYGSNSIKKLEALIQKSQNAR